MISKNSKIFVAGHKGLVGSAIYKLLKKKKFTNILVKSKRDLDLRNHKKVENLFKKNKIKYLIIAAAKAGGILANQNYPTEFLNDNILIQSNLLMSAYKYKVKRTIFLGTSCVYPKYAKTPIKEEYLLGGYLEKTNESYAIAKITGIKLAEALFRQYEQDIICLMPTNIYGPNDKYHPEESHVIPGLIYKFNQAAVKNKNKATVWGSGKPLREFLYSADLADAIYLVLKSPKQLINKICQNKFPLINVGGSKNVSIKDLAYLIKKIINYRGKIIFNKKYPDGTYKKNLDSSKIRKLNWRPTTNLQKGIAKTINDFQLNIDVKR